MWDRFWAKVRVQGACWVWQGSVSGKGYGQIRVAGKLRAAHRMTYRWFVGPIPSWLQLDHLCRNKSCVDPRHLEAVTPSANVRRGHGLGSGHASKTHCPAGHPYMGGNLYVYQSKSGPERQCRTCRREVESRRRQRAREMRTPAAKI